MSKRIVCEVDNELHQRIKEKAVKDGKTIRDVVYEMLRRWMSNKEKILD